MPQHPLITELRQRLASEKGQGLFTLMELLYQSIAEIDIIFKNDVIQLINRQKELNSGFNKGILSLEQKNTEQNKITYSFLTLLDQIENTPSKNPNNEKTIALVQIDLSKIETNQKSISQKEVLYLNALQNYIEDLDISLGYHEKEYTPLSGSFRRKDHVALSIRFRKAKLKDKLGIRPSDIFHSEGNQEINNILEFVVNANHPIIILGEPGSGKSVTLRNIAFEIAEQQSRKEEEDGRIIPIYLQLGSYNQIDEKGNPVPVKDFIKFQLQEIIPGGKNILPFFDTLLEEQRAMVLLDAMDEMPAIDYQKRSEKLKEFLLSYGKSNVIALSCRVREYSGELQHSELLIEPFNELKIKEYLNKSWEICMLEIPPEKRAIAHQEYLKLASKNHLFHDLASNPFFIKLISNYFFTNKGQFPRTQSEIFENFIHNKILREAERMALPLKDQERILDIWGALGLGMIEGKFGSYIAINQIDQIQHISSRYSSQEIDRVITIGQKASLIRLEGKGILRFEHHRILEYLAAYYWEKHKADKKLQEAQLKNPWIRETLNLRAGITDQPDQLIQEILETVEKKLNFFLFINDLFTGLLIRIGTQEPNLENPNSDHLIALESDPESTLEKLEYLASFEVLMACAKQRWEEISQENKTRISQLAHRIAGSGHILDQVRLIRSMKGLPIAYVSPFFQILAKSKSDWVIKEMFASIHPNEKETQEYNTIFKVFMDATSGENAISRLLKIQGVSPINLARKNKYLRGGTFQFIKKTVFYWAGLGVVCAFSYWYSGLWSINVYESFWQPFFYVLLFVLVSLLTAGWRLTLIATITYGALYFIFPALTAFKYYLFLLVYSCLIGPYYWRAYWIRNPIKKYFSIFRNVGFFNRILALFFFWWPTLIILCNSMPEHLRCPSFLYRIGHFVLPLVCEGLFHVWYIIKASNVLRKAHKIQDKNITEKDGLFKKLVNELRAPHPKWYYQRILKIIENYPLDEAKILIPLKQLTDSGQYFINPDALIEVIDKLDLRRRQKELQLN